MMLVSIIIPCYNAELFLSATLESVLTQTHKNWECIIIDDNSSDNSRQIAQNFCNIYPEKFHLLTNPRKGACAARNEGLRVAKGEFIQFLDADDLLSPRKLELQIAHASSRRVKVVFGGWNFYSTQRGNTPNSHYPLFNDFETPLELLLTMWEKGLFLQTACYLTHKSLLENIKWNESLERNQDGEFFARVLLSTKEVRYVPETNISYRKENIESISTTTTYRKIYSAYESYLSYKSIVLMAYDSERTRKALSRHFSGLIYRHHKRFPDIAAEAKKQIDELGVGPQACGGPIFNTVFRLIGFYRTVYLKNLCSILSKG